MSGERVNTAHGEVVVKQRGDRGFEQVWFADRFVGIVNELRGGRFQATPTGVAGDWGSARHRPAPEFDTRLKAIEFLAQHGADREKREVGS